MDQLTIPIPDGLSAEQKKDLTGLLTDLAREATSSEPAIDDDPAVCEEITRRIRRGMADAEAGRVFTPQQARERIARKLGTTPTA